MPSLSPCIGFGSAIATSLGERSLSPSLTRPDIEDELRYLLGLLVS